MVQVSQGNRLELWHPKEKNLNNLLVSEQDLDKTSQIRVLDVSRENDNYSKNHFKGDNIFLHFGQSFSIKKQFVGVLDRQLIQSANNIK